ncbi:hypothetical protein AVEN_78527-1 [Araneus ventricosus]|uniref:Uncharacterized protein n=1 Tax=Araneus ventricosus TaxID=182803 RepID=A0A4Y2EQI1_ARAVE|nr:hypothetical protein AVEN_78527-1 [Araneus ventricosus]
MSLSVMAYRRLEEEKEIISLFYDELISDLIKNHSAEENQIEQAIEVLVFNYSQMRFGRTPYGCDYNNIYHCIGYLHRYGSSHSRMVFEIMHEVWRLPLNDIIYMRVKQNLNVTFIGSGPGNDFVGFLSAMHGMCGFILNVNVMCVERMSGWENVFSATIEKLAKGNSGYAGNVYKRLKIKSSFLKCDITDISGLEQNLKQTLAATDMLFIVKVFSTIPDEKKLRTLTRRGELMAKSLLETTTTTPRHIPVPRAEITPDQLEWM